MHLPIHNVETRPEVLHQFIESNRLGILTTAIRSDTYPRLQSSHIPWVLDSDGQKGSGEFGRLRGHLARQNPQSKAMIEHVTRTPAPDQSSYLEDEVLVLFNGPVDHYVTPKFYKDTKPATGKVVPTWDYEAVEVHGRARIYFDSKAAECKAFLADQLNALSHRAETSIMGHRGDDQPRAWQVSDAPDKYIELMTKNIIGIEIKITSLAGRFKWSQEKPRGDRDGVIQGFSDMGSPLGNQLAQKVRNRASAFDKEKEERRTQVSA